MCERNTVYTEERILQKRLLIALGTSFLSIASRQAEIGKCGQGRLLNRLKLVNVIKINRTWHISIQYFLSLGFLWDLAVIFGDLRQFKATLGKFGQNFVRLKAI